MTGPIAPDDVEAFFGEHLPQLLAVGPASLALIEIPRVVLVSPNHTMADAHIADALGHAKFETLWRSAYETIESHLPDVRLQRLGRDMVAIAMGGEPMENEILVALAASQAEANAEVALRGALPPGHKIQGAAGSFSFDLGMQNSEDIGTLSAARLVFWAAEDLHWSVKNRIRAASVGEARLLSWLERATPRRQSDYYERLASRIRELNDGGG